MFGNGIYQVHLISARCEPAGIDSGSAAGVDDCRRSWRKMAKDQFLGARLLELKPPRPETGGFIS
jgi:hypothetical protein